MSNIKFGVSQMGQPAPKGYRKFENAMIMLVIPTLVLTIKEWGIESTTITSRLLLIVGTVLPALVKGIGVFLGNGEVFAPKSPDENEAT